MWLLAEQEWVRGRRGIAVLRGYLQERTPGQGPTDEALESMFDRLVRRESFPEPIGQFPVRLPFGVVHIDFAYPDKRLAIELDGWAYHGDHKAFDEDRERDAELEALGWTVLRFTWGMLKFRPDWVASIVRRRLSLP